MMPAIFFVTASLLLTSFPQLTFAEGNGSDRGGGDIVAQQFVAASRAVIAKLAERPDCSGNLNLGELARLLDAAQVRSKPWLTLDDVEVSAINYPSQTRIEVSASKWSQDFVSDEARESLGLHEYMGLARMEDSSYANSSQALKCLKSPPSAPKKPTIDFYGLLGPAPVGLPICSVTRNAATESLAIHIDGTLARDDFKGYADALEELERLVSGGICETAPKTCDVSSVFLDLFGTENEPGFPHEFYGLTMDGKPLLVTMHLGSTQSSKTFAQEKSDQNLRQELVEYWSRFGQPLHFALDRLVRLGVCERPKPLPCAIRSSPQKSRGYSIYMNGRPGRSQPIAEAAQEELASLVRGGICAAGSEGIATPDALPAKAVALNSERKDLFSATSTIKNPDGSITYFEPRVDLEDHDRSVFFAREDGCHHANPSYGSGHGLCRAMGHPRGALTTISTRNTGYRNLAVFFENGNFADMLSWHTGIGGCRIFRIASITCKPGD